MDNSNPDLWHEVLSSIKEVIGEVKTDLKEIKVDIKEIQLDVAHHILRTDLLQDRDEKQDEILNQLQRDNWKLKGALALMAFSLMFAATYQFFKQH